jgi:hypothetical protein
MKAIVYLLESEASKEEVDTTIQCQNVVYDALYA